MALQSLRDWKGEVSGRADTFHHSLPNRVHFSAPLLDRLHVHFITHTVWLRSRRFWAAVRFVPEWKRLTAVGQGEVFCWNENLANVNSECRILRSGSASANRSKPYIILPNKRENVEILANFKSINSIIGPVSRSTPLHYTPLHSRSTRCTPSQSETSIFQVGPPQTIKCVSAPRPHPTSHPAAPRQHLYSTNINKVEQFQRFHTTALGNAESTERCAFHKSFTSQGWCLHLYTFLWEVSFYRCVMMWDKHTMGNHCVLTCILLQLQAQMSLKQPVQQQ